MLRFSARLLSPRPPKVLVLTMTPNGGAMTPALRALGYKPYTFENTYRSGNAMSHTKEWRAVLLGQKEFDTVVLSGTTEAKHTQKDKDVTGDNKTGGTSEEGGAAADKNALRDYDALVGPPATLAYRAILRACPRSTRVILVEEGDKLSWEQEFDQVVSPVIDQAAKRGRFVPVMADLHSMLASMTALRRSVSATREARQGTPLSSSSSSTSSSSPASSVGAMQASAMRLGAALDLFEAQVKETVPRDRLLVYRIGEGWGPLCKFLGVPVPTTTTIGGGGEDSAAAPERLPFPPHDSGAASFLNLQSRVSGADRIGFAVALAALALALVLAAAFNAPLWRVVAGYRARYNSILQPYFEEHQGDGSVSLREALRLSKKATMQFEEEVREAGGVVTGLSEALAALADPYGSSPSKDDVVAAK